MKRKKVARNREVIADFAPKRPPVKPSLIPSILIRQVVSDLKWVLGQPESFILHMDTWACIHRNRCEVCAAGAMMVRRLSRVKVTDPRQISEKVYCKFRDAGGASASDVFDEILRLQLMAINILRMGDVAAFLEVLDDAGHRITPSQLVKICRNVQSQTNHSVWKFLGPGRLPIAPTREEVLGWCQHASKLADILESCGH